MGGKRKDKTDHWMPPRVYRGKSAFEYHPAGGGAIRLGSLTASKADIWVEYEKHHNADTKKGSVAFLIEGYMKCDTYINLAPETKKDYRDCKKRIKEVFGKMRAVDVQPKHVRQFMDLRGQKSKSRANRERTYLSNVMSWGFERGHSNMNPCKGVKPFKIKSRDRYVTDEEYKAVYDIAPATFKAVMEIAYLCAARSGDVRQLRLGDMKGEGLFIEQGKTGKKQIKRWTPRLQAVVELAKKQPSRISTTFIIHTKDGQPYSAKGLRGIFGKIIDKAMGICRRIKTETDAEYEARKAIFDKEYPPQFTERFSLHDLKAKGISDYQGDKQYFSGHKTASMMETYNRTADIVDIVDPKK